MIGEGAKTSPKCNRLLTVSGLSLFLAATKISGRLIRQIFVSRKPVPHPFSEVLACTEYPEQFAWLSNHEFPET